MTRWTAAIWLLLAAGAIAGPPVHAQAQVAEPPGPYAIDLRGATMGLPQAATFYPAFPTGTRIPARGFGFDIGAHVYAARLGVARLGFGASVMHVRGTATTAATTTQTFPHVTTTALVWAPQISFNFGTGDGWSYLSAGYDAGRVKTKGSGTPSLERESGGLSGYNAGGGARWFIADHVGVGFDLRLHRLGGASLLSVSAGVSLR